MYFYNLPSGLVAGQSYTVDFKLQRYSGANARLYFFVNNSDEIDISTESALYECLLSDLGNPSNSIWTSANFSFVYSGMSRLHIIIQPTSLSDTTHNFTAWFSAFELSRYNSNAELESLQDIQNSLLDEQNSILDEQNQLQEDIKNGLFNGSDNFEFSEPDMSAIYDKLDDGNLQLRDNVGQAMNNQHILNGVKAFATLFDLTISEYDNYSETSWINNLIWFSVGLSVLAFALGLIGVVDHRKGG